MGTQHTVPPEPSERAEREPEHEPEREPEHDHAALGVLLVNLGTPASPDVADVRAYLRQFLSDRRVVDLPRLFWWPILYGIVLPVRARKSAEAYASIWTEAGSPLLAISRQQAASLRARLGPGFDVELAMRYGEPSIAAGLDNLRARGARRIALLAMFPQYSGATTGSIEAEAFRALAERRSQTPLVVLPPWFDEPGYLTALEERARKATLGRAVSHWVISFHGLPERYVRRGDPYRDHCERTARALAARLGLAEADWTLAFQSRFGPEAWLQPYTDQVVPALARRHPRVAITMPGFATDCLETLEEIGLRLSAAFRAAGGEDLVVVPCVNDSPSLIEGLARRIRAVPD